MSPASSSATSTATSREGTRWSAGRWWPAAGSLRWWRYNPRSRSWWPRSPPPSGGGRPSAGARRLRFLRQEPRRLLDYRELRNALTYMGYDCSTGERSSSRAYDDYPDGKLELTEFSKLVTNRPRPLRGPAIDGDEWDAPRRGAPRRGARRRAAALCSGRGGRGGARRAAPTRMPPALRGARGRSVEDVQEWAMEMKLSDVARAFERAKIDSRKLIALTPQTVGKSCASTTRRSRSRVRRSRAQAARGGRRRRQRSTRVPGGAWGGGAPTSRWTSMTRPTTTPAATCRATAGRRGAVARRRASGSLSAARRRRRSTRRCRACRGR